MRFRVIGLERGTGDPVDITFDAPTPSAAEEKANRMGVMVERIDLTETALAPLPPPPTQAAPTAPSGRPLVVRPVPTVQTIEKTGKIWKAIQLLSACAMIIGIPMVCSSVSSGPSASPPSPVGILLALLGFLGVIVGRVGAWWYHG
ncbi:MAG: hypothetical protein V2A79_09090 [Planctomycetota bacterium]